MAAIIPPLGSGHRERGASVSFTSKFIIQYSIFDISSFFLLSGPWATISFCLEVLIVSAEWKRKDLTVEGAKTRFEHLLTNKPEIA